MVYPVQNEVRNKLDLSGIWDFQADLEELGEQNRWFGSLEKPRPIAVPGSWNKQYEDLYNFLGLSWYVKRTFIPSSWQGQRVFLRVGSANYYGAVYVNCTKVGSHEGGQILLNGKPVQMNGFGRREDFIASGKGLNLPLMVKDYQLMRWTGANSFRTSHYPYSEEEMQMADREGFLVIEETPAVSLQFDSEENMGERMRMCLQQIEEMVTQDKNHPSVVMWCVANEPMPRNMNLAGAGSTNSDAPGEAAGKAFLEKLLSRARELDSTRLVKLVTLMGGPVSWMEQCDVICMNRYWGWYVLGGQLDKALVMLENELDKVWEMWHKPIMMTEFGADTMAGVHGQPNVMWTEEYQADYMRGHLSVAARKPYVAGMQLWNFADFAAVQSIMRVGGLNMKGVFTRTRQPKKAAHVLRDFWVKPAPTK
jgi:beta-glucuronidase